MPVFANPVPGPDSTYQVSNIPAASSLVVGSRSRRSALTIVAGAAGILAEFIIVLSYLLPYATYDASGSNPSASFAQFYECSGGSCTALPWIIGAAAIQVSLGIAAAILLMALEGRMVLAIASGALLALGVHEFADWLGFVSQKDYGGHLAVGIPIGMMGAVFLFAAGLTAAIDVAARRSPTG